MALGRKTGGRKKGTPNKVTQEVQAAVAASGSTPRDVLLGYMRWAEKKARLAERNGDAARARARKNAAEEATAEAETLHAQADKLRNFAAYCAIHAAPYCHARFAPIEQKPGEQGSGHEEPRAPDPNRLAAIAARFGRGRNLTVIDGGETKQSQSRT